MRRKRMHQDEAGDVNVTPLLDIVFIMLIFFIVTATFIDEEGHSLANPNNDDSESDGGGATLLLTVFADGRVQADLREIDPRSVRSNVETFLAENPGGAILINAEPSAETGLSVLVLDQVKGVDGANVSLALAREQ